MHGSSCEKRVREIRKIIAIFWGIAGGMIGLVSAINAFVAVGGDPAYGGRLWAGWLALLPAAVAGGAALFLSSRPAVVSLTMLIAGVAGFACINLFYINTLYGLAVPLWIAATVLAFITARTFTRQSGAN
jgi:hypothetical protein